MDFKSEEQILGLFNRKVYVGHFFAPQKFEDADYTEEYKLYKAGVEKKNAKLKDEELKEDIMDYDVFAEEEYGKYLKTHEKKEHIIFREPSQNELQSMEFIDTDEWKRAPVAMQEQLYRKVQDLIREVAPKNLDVMTKCISGSSFTLNGKPMEVSMVAKIVNGNSPMMMYCFGKFMRMSQGFRIESGEN